MKSISVWEREHEEAATMSKGAYINAVSMWTVGGLLLASFMAIQTLEWQPSLWGLLGVGLAIPIAGIFIALGSNQWPVSALGYSMVCVGLGAITGPTVGMMESGVVMNALFATAGVTIVMSITGMVYPGSLESWGSYLFAGLLALLLVRIGQIFMASMGIAGSGELWFVDYLAAVLFSAYIIYDWNRALSLPYTLDNAIDAALALFLDIINLFITMLRIYADAKD